MQTEVIYGKELLDRYYSIHGQPEANGEHLGEEVVTK
jgi:hypothetical protein